MKQRDQRRRSRSLLHSPQVRAAAFVGCVVVVLWLKPMGLLLWARLRILANIPRTAIAEDEQMLAERFAPQEWPTLPSIEYVILPKGVSRNPFANVSPTVEEPRHQSDSPRKPTTTGTFNPTDGDGRAKSSNETVEEKRSGDPDGSGRQGTS
jgi:hypothetical protein